MRVAINLSNRHRNLPAFFELAESVLALNGLPRELLIFEITESFALAETDKLRTAHEAGLGLAIDDFGTGDSSLSYLRRLPADILKIDRSFINELGINADDTMLVEAIIAIAHGLRLKVVAEGVETQEQAVWLANADCDYIQGYFYAKPMPGAEFLDYLHASVRDAAAVG